MDFFKIHLLLPLLLLLIVGSTSQIPAVSEARVLSLRPQIKYKKVYATLGVVCKCCDGAGGECKSTWAEPCSKFQCLPWKLH
ncbi:hypothetical protein NMG60_11005346 [Bertholletia excelsa]